jgi:flavin reductase (DIM6/NTAB) family NADH-FMN oxidoreductase RutF
MKSHINRIDIERMEQRYRAALINSVTGFKSVSLIGTENNQQQSNLAIFSSVVHLGAHPPLIGLIVRPDSAERHTLSNIEDTGFYTINHIHSQFYKSAHQSSARYEKSQSEFDECGLTRDYKDGFSAPYVMESHLQMGIQFRQRINIEINTTILIIGEIQHLYLDPAVISKEGFVDLEQLGSLTCSGLDSYHLTQRLSRLSYAKPGVALQELKPLF